MAQKAQISLLCVIAVVAHATRFSRFRFAQLAQRASCRHGSPRFRWPGWLDALSAAPGLRGALHLTHTAERANALRHRELDLPQEWADDAVRRQEAGVPESVTFATKPELARRMLERARAADIPAAWVTGDSVYSGNRTLRVWLEQQQQPFVLAVASNESRWATVEERWGQYHADVVAASAPAEQWQRLSAGVGAKGPRLYDWALVPLARLQLSAEERRWSHALLVRRSLSDPTALAYYVVFAPVGTPLQTLVEVAGQRWRIEQSFALAKGEAGLYHYEVRRWDGWYRHMTLAMFALAYLAVLRAHTDGGQRPEQGGP